MNRALVIGSRSNVRASKLTTPDGVGAGWRHAITPMARPPATPAATASGSHQRRARGASMGVVVPGADDESDIASRANAMSLAD